MTIAVVTSEIVLDDGWSFVSGLADTDGPAGVPAGSPDVGDGGDLDGLAPPQPSVPPPRPVVDRLAVSSPRCCSGPRWRREASRPIAIGLLGRRARPPGVGSPGGRPDAARIRLALEELGIDVDDLVPASMQREGAVLFDAHEADGPSGDQGVRTRRLGRPAAVDAVAAGLVPRHPSHGPAVARRARRARRLRHPARRPRRGARAEPPSRRAAPAAATPWSSSVPTGWPSPRPGPRTSPRGSRSATTASTRLWSELDRLHDAGITHRQIDLDRVLLHDDGTLGFGDLSSATVTGAPASRSRDRAQVLALSILAARRPARPRRGATSARRRGRPRDPAVPPGGRGASRDCATPSTTRQVDLDDTRGHFTEELGAEAQPLIRLRRVTRGSLLNLALMVFAAYAVIGLLGDLDLETFVDELADAQLVVAGVRPAARPAGRASRRRSARWARCSSRCRSDR